MFQWSKDGDSGVKDKQHIENLLTKLHINKLNKLKNGKKYPNWCSSEKKRNVSLHDSYYGWKDIRNGTLRNL